MIKIFENFNMKELIYSLYIFGGSRSLSENLELYPPKANQRTLVEDINPF